MKRRSSIFDDLWEEKYSYERRGIPLPRRWRAVEPPERILGPATLLSAKAKINRCRLSNIERGYAQASAYGIQRLNAALGELIRASQSFGRRLRHSDGQ